jgi:hypothetical protein
MIGKGIPAAQAAVYEATRLVIQNDLEVQGSANILNPKG